MNPPQAPDSLPKYIAEGIPKQDDSTIEDLRKYSQAILEHRQQTRAEKSMDHTYTGISIMMGR